MFNYKRIIVIGCPGAGKSTFSRKLRDATGIELHYLDYIYWNEDATHISRHKLIKEQKRIFKKESFIIDGNFKSTLELRIKEADVVFFLICQQISVYMEQHIEKETDQKCLVNYLIMKSWLNSSRVSTLRLSPKF